MKTLGDALQETRMMSSARRKLRRFGFPTEAHWIQLAIQRGCRHYQQEGPPVQDPGPGHISNLEISAALLSNESAYNPEQIRVAAQLISGETNPDLILRIAKQERLETILRHIAQSGHIVEPENIIWQFLLEQLPERHPPEAALPHRDRYTTESPVRAGELRRMRSKKWLRPQPPELLPVQIPNSKPEGPTKPSLA